MIPCIIILVCALIGLAHEIGFQRGVSSGLDLSRTIQDNAETEREWKEGAQ